MGLPVDIHWTDALLEELRHTVGHVRWLRDQVAELDASALVWGVTDEVNRGSGEYPGIDFTRAARPSVWHELYMRERKHLVDVVRVCGGSEASERQLRLAERQADVMHAVFGRVMAGLGLSAGQAALLPALLAREIGELTAPVRGVVADETAAASPCG
jgi:hypothetical protein